MRLYLASGYSVMHVKGREAEIRNLFGMKRLFSYADYLEPSQRLTKTLEVHTNHTYSKREGESEL